MTPAEHLQVLEQLGVSGQWAVGEIIRLTLENLRLRAQGEADRAQHQQHTAALEEQLRQAHRSAAPFRRPENERSPHPARPGRQPGHAGCYRPVPAQVDEHLQVPLDGCPHCHGPVSQKRSLTQSIEEIPEVRPRVTQLTTEAGWCEHCQCEVGSTHPMQTGRAGGAAAVQLGPRALALACDLNKAKGLSMRKTVAVLRDHFGLSLTP